MRSNKPLLNAPWQNPASQLLRISQPPPKQERTVNDRSVTRWDSEITTQPQSYIWPWTDVPGCQGRGLHSLHVDDLSRRYHRILNLSWAFVSLYSCFTFHIWYSYSYIICIFAGNLLHHKFKKFELCSGWCRYITVSPFTPLTVIVLRIELALAPSHLMRWPLTLRIQLPMKNGAIINQSPHTFSCEAPLSGKCG